MKKDSIIVLRNGIHPSHMIYYGVHILIQQCVFSLDMCHRTDHCIEVRDKCIFDYNFEVAFPLTQNCLNIKCRGNDTDDIIFVGVLHAIRKFSPEVVQRILNMK